MVDLLRLTGYITGAAAVVAMIAWSLRRREPLGQVWKTGMLTTALLFAIVALAERCG